MQDFLLYIRTKAFFKNILAALTTVIVAVLVIFYSLRFYTKHGEGVEVPMLKNLKLEKAVAILEDKGLNYEIDSVYVMDKAPGVVLEQDPDYSLFVKNGRTIYLTVNTNVAPNVKFPDIEFKSFKEAQVILANFGLILGDTTYVADVSKDVVLEIKFAGTLLKKGQDIPKGSRIDLVLGNGMGNSQIEIPNLMGLTKDEALFSLKGSSLTLGQISYEGNIIDSSTAVIIRQNPGLSDSVKTVAIGSPIHITLSNR